ncbi:MAG: YaiI/YqxD family protein [Gammaproteobacteria bacterium]
MQIWVDADACPKTVKEILFRAAERLHLSLTLVANHALTTPPSRFIRFVRVPGGFDVADEYIGRNVKEGDLVITADIPLAADVIEKNGFALNPRGDFYTKNNIKECLAMRNFMEELRGSGVDTGGPAAFGLKDRQAFANQLDKFLAGLSNK